MTKKINSGTFLIVVGIIYLIAGFANVAYHVYPMEYLQVAFVAILISPLLIKPIGDMMDMPTIWNTYTKYKEMKDNVVKFPEPVQYPQMPSVAPPVQKAGKEHYRIGYDNEREMVTVTMLDSNNYAVSTLSMNQSAAEQFIRMIRSAFPQGAEK
jgi:hypothetical protein